MPRDPFALALSWDFQDGRPAGIPVLLRCAVLGGPARVAVRPGYPRRRPENAADLP
ncbi:hypothetical protein [Nocardia abscessus]|uniref:hypothetical protein n=1 Tax=Nocardia abscessus TaxID=120957 RepID=UPI002454C624|nr:hypothetical protein [Nocardia abscessus]